MALPRSTISGLDINRTNICYTRSLPEDRVISNVCIQPLEIGAADYWQSVSSGFDEFLKEFKVPGENVVTSLPGEYAIIKKIMLESDETDIDDALEWELSQQIIGSIDDYVYDYQKMPSAQDENLHSYLVVGYRNTAVARLSKLLRMKKLNPIIVDLDIFALINVFELNYDDLLALPTLIILSQETKTKLILTTKGDFIDVAVLDHNEDMQTSEGYINELNNTINKLFAFNTQFSNPDSVRTYLAGSYFSLPENANNVMGAIKNSEMLFPFRKISCSAGMDDEKLKEFAPLLAVSVGLALRDID